MALVSILQPLLLLLISCHYVAAQNVALQRSGPLCPREMVTYNCSVTQGFALEWILDPFIPINDTIRFLTTTLPENRRVGCNDVRAVSCTDLDFVATLTSITNPITVVVEGNTVMLYDMTSTLTFTATTRLNERVVQCRGSNEDGIMDISNTTLNFSAPSPPRTPSSTVQQYDQNSVTLTVQWQPPQYDSGAPVNYTITVSPGLSPDLSPVTTSGTSVPVTVPYNVIHTVSIVATNCIGNSSAAMETIRIVNCGDPTAPRNGSINSYQNTTEGAQIVFRCDPGLVPAGDMAAVCAANGSWTPNPATTMCSSSTGTKVLLPLGALVLAVIGTLVLTI